MSHPRQDEERAERESAPEWLKAIFGGGSAVDHEDRESIKSIASEAGTVCFEAELVQPKSSRFRTVWVYVPPEQVLALLKMCREAASEQREQAMSDVAP
jgi:hypothetical protein